MKLKNTKHIRVMNSVTNVHAINAVILTTLSTLVALHVHSKVLYATNNTIYSTIDLLDIQDSIKAPDEVRES